MREQHAIGDGIVQRLPHAAGPDCLGEDDLLVRHPRQRRLTARSPTITPSREEEISRRTGKPERAGGVPYAPIPAPAFCQTTFRR